jgi:hypothetical protein
MGASRPTPAPLGGVTNWADAAYPGGPKARASRPVSAPNAKRLQGATTHWPTSEMTFHRDSFNATVQHRKINSTESMIRQANMGRQAELGPEWVPSALACRKQAELIKKV